MLEVMDLAWEGSGDEEGTDKEDQLYFSCCSIFLVLVIIILTLGLSQGLQDRSMFS